MVKSSRLAVNTLCLVLLLTSAVIPVRANSDNAGDAHVVLPAGAASAPIGTIESVGPLVINGRAADGSGPLWNGEQIQAPAGTEARATLDGIGQVRLKSGATAQLAAVAIPGQGGRASASSRMLAVSLRDGEVEIRLQPTAGAYLIAGGAAFVVAAGAEFRIALKNGQPFILEDKSLAVRWLGNWGIRQPLSLTDESEKKTTRDGTAAIKAAPSVIAANAPLPVAGPAMEKSSNAGGKVTPKIVAETGTAQREWLLRSIGLVTGSRQHAASAPLRLYANPMAGMIGTVEAPKAMMINGRRVQGRELIWDGEILQAPPDASARVTIDGLGQVTLAAASSLKLSTTTVRPDERSTRRVLVASIISGEAIFRLQPDSAAVVGTAGSSFAAEGGAHFRLIARDGKAVVEAASGSVVSIGRYVIELTMPVAELMDSLALAREQMTPRKYRIGPVGFGYQTIVPPRTTQELRFKVVNENGTPAAAVLVAFRLSQAEGKPVGTLGNGLLRTLSYTGTTNAEGTITVPFTAGEEAGSVSLNATVNDSPPTRTSVVVVPGNGSEKGFWTPRHAIPVLLTGAAILGLGLGVAATREDKLPIKRTGNLVIVP